MSKAAFGSVAIFREHSLFGLIVKSRIYANEKLIAKVGNCSLVSFLLSPGDYQIYARNPQISLPFRRRNLLHSNTIKIKIKEGEKYYLNLRPHPLYFWGKHHPEASRPFTPVECLLLLKQDKAYQDNLRQIDRIGSQIITEIKLFSFHPFTLFWVIGISLFALVSSIRQPDLYATGDGIAWGFLFGLSNLIALLNGRNKRMLANGWEHKLLLYAAVGAVFVFLFIPANFLWQRFLYFFFVSASCFWAYFCYQRWKEKKKGLDKIEQMELVFEEGL